MRHRIRHRKLNRKSEHRKALHRNLAQSLIEHGQVTTTLAKGKDIRPYFERLVTLAIKVRARAVASDQAGALRARRGIYRLMGDRGLVPAEQLQAYTNMSDAARVRSMRMVSGRRYRTGEPKGRLAFTAQSATHRLIETIAPRFEGRPGGYTRLIRLPTWRIGDSARLVTVQLVGKEEAPTSLTKPKRSARRRRTDARYAMAIKLGKRWASKGRDSASAVRADEKAPAGLPEPTDPAPADDAGPRDGSSPD
ncbi:MAG: 50S ribosomal protein L17 [Planctomycetes bacterium]|nr:50S ribosomal protein L17 [Planctomycetota bacterium]